jgi:putative SbcD/Mre11-related phosphoesterase
VEKYPNMDYVMLQDERALLFREFLVIGDLHLGYAKTLEERGYSIPNQVNEFVKRIKELKKKTNAKKLIILGDVKHMVPKIAYDEKYDIPNFFYELSKEFEEIIVTKGNHDGRIEAMVHEKNVKILKEFLIGHVGFIHGHAWPSEEFMSKCKILVMGHAHPNFKLEDKLGVRHNFPCWIIGKLNKKKMTKFKDTTIEEALIVPTFNRLFMGYEHFAGPFSKALKRKDVFLLDLTKIK